jgi:hypothetical protein
LVNDELRIIRNGDDSEVLINRHRWLSYALQTPALQRWDDMPRYVRQLDEPADGPIFRLTGGRENQPAPHLFWMDGQVVVRHVEDDWLRDLRSIASQLEGRLVQPSGEDA